MITAMQQKELFQAVMLINSVRIDLMSDDDRDNEDEQELSEIENMLSEFIDEVK